MSKSFSASPNFKARVVDMFKNKILIGAILLSLMIWLTIRSQFQTQDQFSVNVDVQTRENEVPLGTPTPGKVTVTLKGNKSLLDNLRGEDIKILLSTGMGNRTEDGRHVWKLRPSDIQLPFHVGIRIDRIEPSEISLLLDERITEKRKVEVVLDETSLPDGYKVGKVSVVPDEVNVSAPATKLKQLKTIRTQPISLEGVTHSFDCDQEFDKNYPRDFDFLLKNVLVQVEILRANKTRIIQTLPVKILVPPSSRQQTMSCEIVSAPTVDLEVSGAENVIDLLRKEDIFIFADVSTFNNPGLYRIDLRCAIEKNGITSFKINPPNVNVKLERIKR